MSEMTSALAVLGAIRDLYVIQNPAGTYSFVGRVDARLSYFKRDGSELTEEDAQNIRRYGSGLFRKTIGTRTYPTKEAAIEAARSLGYSPLEPIPAK